MIDILCTEDAKTELYNEFTFRLKEELNEMFVKLDNPPNWPINPLFGNEEDWFTKIIEFYKI